MFRARRFAPALGFLLLTPQVWYVFSYINGDALPFALLTVLLIELGCPDSSVRRFLKGAQARPTPAVLVVGALLGLLAISKRNYLVSFVFLGWVILWLRSEVRSWRRVAVLTSITALIALPWLTYHAWMNDWETEKRVADYSELVASPDLKPSVQAGPHSSPYRALRAKGASLWDVVVTLPWVDHSFRSFCGLYGWMDTVADPWVYRVFGGLYAALLAMLVIPSLREGSPRSVPVDRRSGRRHARSRAINLPILGVRLPGAGTVPVSHSPDAVLLLATVRDSASTRPGARRGDAARDPRALLLRSDRPRPPRLRTEPRPSLPAARETSALAVVLQRFDCLRRECR